MGVRIINPVIPVSVMGRIDHGTDIIHMLCQFPVDLAHGLGIDTAVDDGSIDVRGHKESLFLEPGI